MKPTVMVRVGGAVVEFVPFVIGIFLDAPWWVFVLLAVANVLGFLQGRASVVAEQVEAEVER